MISPSFPWKTCPPPSLRTATRPAWEGASSRPMYFSGIVGRAGGPTATGAGGGAAPPRGAASGGGGGEGRDSNRNRFRSTLSDAPGVIRERWRRRSTMAESFASEVLAVAPRTGRRAATACGPSRPAMRTANNPRPRPPMTSTRRVSGVTTKVSLGSTWTDRVTRPTNRCHRRLH
jgi:hypothetical protein